MSENVRIPENHRLTRTESKISSLMLWIYFQIYKMKENGTTCNMDSTTNMIQLLNKQAEKKNNLKVQV